MNVLQSQFIKEDDSHRHRLLEGIKILVVDDEADAGELITTILEAAGAVTIPVSNATEALDTLLQLKPNLLISDIGMPLSDGYSLIRKVRELNPEQGGKIPALALTAFARTEDRNQAIIAGYQEHIAKPVEPKELVNAIATLIGEKEKGRVNNSSRNPITLSPLLIRRIPNKSTLHVNITSTTTRIN